METVESTHTPPKDISDFDGDEVQYSLYLKCKDAIDKAEQDRLKRLQKDDGKSSSTSR